MTDPSSIFGRITDGLRLCSVQGCRGHAVAFRVEYELPSGRRLTLPLERLYCAAHVPEDACYFDRPHQFVRAIGERCHCERPSHDALHHIGLTR